MRKAILIIAMLASVGVIAGAQYVSAAGLDNQAMLAAKGNGCGPCDQLVSCTYCKVENNKFTMCTETEEDYFECLNADNDEIPCGTCTSQNAECGIYKTTDHEWGCFELEGTLQCLGCNGVEEFDSCI